MDLSPGMLTDRYELTMLSSWVNDGSVHHRAVFEAFARKLPDGRRYGLLGGLGRLLDLVEAFRFSDDEVGWLREQGVVSEATAAYLRDFRFTGDIDAYPEGDLYFPGSPILTVTGSLGECIVLETLVLSVLNHDSRDRQRGGPDGHRGAGTTRSSRWAAGAPTRRRRSPPPARPTSPGSPRPATSQPVVCYGIPTVGTAAHAFVLAHESEEAAFRSQVEAQGTDTTLLVDTFDITDGIRTAVKVAGPGLGAVRIDSGDLAEESRKARALLDELGATGTRIIVTSDLDEFVITALQDAPIDGYGVGTRVATGSGHPTAAMVYKLVAVADQPGRDAPLRPVAKKSAAKVSVGGRKSVHREYADGVLTHESFTVDDRESDVQVPAIRDGVVVHRPTLGEIREHAARAVASLPSEARDVAAGVPYLTVQLEGDQP